MLCPQQWSSGDKDEVHLVLLNRCLGSTSPLGSDLISCLLSVFLCVSAFSVSLGSGCDSVLSVSQCFCVEKWVSFAGQLSTQRARGERREKLGLNLGHHSPLN